MGTCMRIVDNLKSSLVLQSLDQIEKVKEEHYKKSFCFFYR